MNICGGGTRLPLKSAMVGRSQHKNEMGPCGEDGHRQQHTQTTHSTMGVRDERGGECGGGEKLGVNTSANQEK